MRDAREYLYMTILLVPTLKQILEGQNCENDGNEVDDNENKFMDVKKALKHVKDYCPYFSFPDYIQKYFFKV
jgi:hypothetical protein